MSVVEWKVNFALKFFSLSFKAETNDNDAHESTLLNGTAQINLYIFLIVNLARLFWAAVSVYLGPY